MHTRIFKRDEGRPRRLLIAPVQLFMQQLCACCRTERDCTVTPRRVHNLSLLPADGQRVRATIMGELRMHVAIPRSRRTTISMIDQMAYYSIS